jgi:hypothetical protein
MEGATKAVEIQRKAGSRDLERFITLISRSRRVTADAEAKGAGIPAPFAVTSP